MHVRGVVVRQSGGSYTAARRCWRASGHDVGARRTGGSSKSRRLGLRLAELLGGGRLQLRRGVLSGRSVHGRLKVVLTRGLPQPAESGATRQNTSLVSTAEGGIAGGSAALRPEGRSGLTLAASTPCGESLMPVGARLRSVTTPSTRCSPRGWIRHLRSIVVVVLLTCYCTSVATGLYAQQVIRLERITETTSDRLRELGVVVEAAADPQGRIFILDRTGPRIVIADGRLRLLGYFGRRGSGPGEFREPVSIGILADGRVAVLDRALRRVTLLAVRDGGRSLQVQHTVSLRIASESMCLLTDNKLLVYGFSAGKRLHVVDLDARRLRSFAPADSKLSPMAQELMAQGRIACDELHDEVLVSSRFVAVVEAFRISTGERSWVDTLRPFRAIVVSDRGAKVSISSGRAGFSLISSLFRFNDYRVFQTVYGSRLDNPEVDTVVSYVYSTRARIWMPPEFHAPVLFPLKGARALAVEDERAEIQLNRLIVGNGRAEARPPNPRE